MSDPTPDNTNRIAYWIGRIFHPAVLPVPTLLLILNEIPLLEALQWTAFIAVIVIVPGLMVIAYNKQQDRFTYQRESRDLIYLVGWLSVMLCLGLLWLFDAPIELQVCLASLAVWLPLQAIINRYLTKISTHTAVASGCYSGLLVLDKLQHPAAIGLGLLIVLLVAWARVMTKNHTLTQVLLGIIVGGGSVLVVFSLLLA